MTDHDAALVWGKCPSCGLQFVRALVRAPSVEKIYCSARCNQRARSRRYVAKLQAAYRAAKERPE